jgi:HlyD family secretion protein/adhesin transport system membrane fusion protein
MTQLQAALPHREPGPDRHILALEEAPLRAPGRALVLGVAILLGGFGYWAAITRLPEVALAPGEVVTTLAAAPVQHLEGGIVEAVLVAEGEAVAAGQGLLRLNDAAAQAELGQMSARLGSLRLQAARLEAIAAGRLPLADVLADLAGPQRLALDARLAAQADRRATAAQQAAQRRAEIATLAGQMAALDRQLPLLRDELATRQGLSREGLTTRVAVLEAQRSLLTAEAERERLAGQSAAARSALAEAEARAAELLSAPVDEARAEAARVAAEAAEVEAQIRRAEDRVARTLITAPGEGVVRGLVVTRPGAVLAPGAMVAEILPREATLSVDARAEPRDIGFLRLGQEVRLKVAAYDFARFGTVPGRVERISAGVFQDANRLPYHRVRVALTQEHVGDDPNFAPLAAGMTVQAEITTGRKSVLHYMLKPIYAATATAFRER